MIRREDEKAPQQCNGLAPVPVRAKPWSLRAYLEGRADHVDEKDAEISIEIVRGLVSGLVTALNHPTQPGVRELLRKRVALVHRMVAALGPRPGPRGGRGLGSSQRVPLEGAQSRASRLDTVKTDG